MHFRPLFIPSARFENRLLLILGFFGGFFLFLAFLFFRIKQSLREVFKLVLLQKVGVFGLVKRVSIVLGNEPFHHDRIVAFFGILEKEFITFEEELFDVVLFFNTQLFVVERLLCKLKHLFVLNLLHSLTLHFNNLLQIGPLLLKKCLIAIKEPLLDCFFLLLFFLPLILLERQFLLFDLLFDQFLFACSFLAI